MAQERKTLAKPANYDQLFPGRFLKAGLLQEIFGTVRPIVTIKDYDLEVLPQDDGTEKGRGIITLAETPMQFTLNKTNGECLKAMFGPSLRDWVGKRIVFCIEKDRDPGGPKGATCDTIRVFGSPDIQEDIDAKISRPISPTKKKVYTRKLVAIAAGSKPAAREPQKLRGNIDDAIQKIHTTDSSLMRELSESLRAFSWTDDELGQIKLAYEVRKTNG